MSGQLNEYSDQTFYLNSGAYSEDYHHPENSKTTSNDMADYSESKALPIGEDHGYGYSSELFSGNNRTENGQYPFGGFQYSSGPIYPMDLSSKFYSNSHNGCEDISGRRLKDLCHQNSDLLHREISSEGGNVEHPYSNYAQNVGIINDNNSNNWMNGNHYEFNQFDDFLQDESSDRHPGSASDPSLSQQTILISQSSSGLNNGHHHFLGPLEAAIHVNPAIIDGNYGLPDKLINLTGLGDMGCHSGKLVDHCNEMSISSQKKAPRQAGLPTNIIPTARMDRKTLKRLRNRVSASRCRVKKKNWIKDMEETSDALALENRKLVEKITKLEHAINQCKALLNIGGNECPGAGLTQKILSSSTLVMDLKESSVEHERDTFEGMKHILPKITKKKCPKA